jgi:hypothetical protein
MTKEKSPTVEKAKQPTSRTVDDDKKHAERQIEGGTMPDIADMIADLMRQIDEAEVTAVSALTSEHQETHRQRAEKLKARLTELRQGLKKD